MSKSKTLSEMGEFGLLDLLKQSLPTSSSREYIGIGDDCAVLPFDAFRGESVDKNSKLLFTVDAMVEGVHFKRELSSAGDLGWKLLARSLSDIAAMGGSPGFCVVTAYLTPDLELRWVSDFYDGLKTLAEQHGVFICGGDTTRSATLSFSLAILGHCSSKPLLRSGAEIGDDLWVSGTLGEAFIGYDECLSSAATKHSALPRDNRYLKPVARVELGRELLSRKLATSAIDVSDGIFQDVTHLARSSDVTIEIEIENLPVSESVRNQPERRLQAVTWGDDYELLFTSAAENREKLELLSTESVSGKALPNVVRIGTVKKRGSALITVRENEGRCSDLASFLSLRELTTGGYRHF